MDPQVRFCRAADGVRLAYTVTGGGPPLMLLNEASASHVRLEWQHPLFGPVFRHLAERFTLIRFDPRGSGMSDRVLPQGPETRIADLRAIVEAASLDGFSIAAINLQCATALLFASLGSGVERMVLIDPMIPRRFEDAGAPVRALYAAAKEDFVVATDILGGLVFGVTREEASAYGAYIRECIDPAFFSERPQPLDPSASSADVLQAAAEIEVPTLVIHHTKVPYVTRQQVLDVVAAIRAARLLEIEGMWADDLVGLFDHGAAFLLDEELTSPTPSLSPPASGVRTILFTDLVGHTAMMQRLGDTKGRDVLREHERMTRETLKRHGGHEIKTDGDSFMISFGSVTSAVDCAIALQRAFAARNEGADEALHVRIGLNAGEPVEEDGDLFGSTVILASRIAAKAGAGEILVPDTVRGLLSGKGFLFSDRGEFVPRGFDEGVRLWDVRWHE